MKKNLVILFIITLLLVLKNFMADAQMITGVWHGRMNKQKVEIKIVQKGDSLTGSSYYYESPNHYRRYSIKGYFDATTNSTVWWDDQLLEQKPDNGGPVKTALLARADFNCPGGGIMMLDGKAALKQDNTKLRGDLHLDKNNTVLFPDEWDFVIENYTAGANNPDIIDSINAITGQQPIETIIAAIPPPATHTGTAITPKSTETPIVIQPVETTIPKPLIITPAPTPSIEEKYISRKKIVAKEIELEGDSVELRFYDNAEIDGDSISLFLNDRLIFEHIRLTAAAYTIKLAVIDLEENNELTMVAENLGAIPPNTSYMVAVVGDKRYEAYLASTENSSAVIRFVKKR